MGSAFSHHVRKLLEQERCPVCGAVREFKAGEWSGLHAMSVFHCGAEFMVGNGEIISSRPCKAGSLLAAQAMNAEAEVEIGKAGAA